MGMGDVKAETPLDAEADRIRDELAYHEHRAKVLESPLISRGRFRSLFEDLLRLEDAGAHQNPDALTRRSPAPPRLAFYRRPLPGVWPTVLGIATERALRGHYNALVAKDSRLGILVGSAWLLGVEVVLSYRDGLLEQALIPNPSGDADGLDVTDNARTLGSIPLRLRLAGTTTESRITRLTKQALGPSTLTPVPPAPEQLFVRGVVTMRITDLLALDRRRVDAGLPPYLDPAAAISASFTTLDPALTASREMSFFADDASWSMEEVETHWQLLGALKSWGFRVGALHFRAASMNEVLDFVRVLKEERSSFDYPVEGGVLTVNRRAEGQESGPPRRALLEFQTRGHEARLRHVYFAVGRSGVVFPVAQLERSGGGSETVPVPARVEPEPRSLAEDQSVRVVAGAIAPRILLSGDARRAPYPETCPACAQPLQHTNEPYFGSCPDRACPGRRRARLLHLVGPRGLGLSCFDVNLVDRLLQAGGPDDLAGLLALDPARVEALAAGRGARFAEQIASVRSLALWRVIYLSALDEVGERFARLAASMAGAPNGLVALSQLPFRPEALEPVPWEALCHWMRIHGPKTLDTLASAGISIEGEDTTFAAPFASRRILILGRARSFEPGLLVDAIERRGGTVDARPSRRTDFFVRGEGASEELATMALHYGSPEVEESTLRAIIEAS